MRHKVLIFGRTGQVASELLRAAWPREYDIVPLDRSNADLEKPEQVRRAVEHFRPSIVINAAAYTAVDKAEAEAEKARTVNSLSPAAIAGACEQTSIPFITYSSDYVFDGLKSEEYTEEDTANPISVYGQTKEESERLIRSICSRHLILRTSWVYSAGGRNFVRTMLRMGSGNSVLKVVDDQVGKPTFATDLAIATISIAKRLLEGSDLFGIYHVAGDGYVSWHGFAEAIFAGARERGWKTPLAVESITTAEFPTPARRPANSRLNTDRIARDFGICLPKWQTSLKLVLDGLIGPTGH